MIFLGSIIIGLLVAFVLADTIAKIYWQDWE
jgi:hypothetical protein